MENTLQRTTEEILAYVKALSDGTNALGDPADPYGWKRQPLMIALPYEEALPFLKNDIAPSEWEQHTDPAGAILDHLPIAWHESVGENKMGYDCAMARLQSWVWLYDAKLYGEVSELSTHKEKLQRISDHFGYDHKAFMAEEAAKGGSQNA